MPDVQSPLLGVVHLIGRYAAPPAAADVQSDVFSAYRAHAVTRFPAYESAPMLGVINLQYLGLSTVFCFLLGYCFLENRRGQLSDPCLSLTNKVPWYRGNARVLGGTG